MNHLRFDDVTRQFSRLPSRRHLLGGLASGILGLGAGQLADLATANKKRKKRKGKKVRPNEFGCLEFGDPCQSEGDCCSGICGGKKGNRRCKGHDSGGCVAGSATVGCGGAYVGCTTDLGETGACVTTTGNAGYCVGPLMDYPCQTDVDCQVVDGGRLGPRAACIRCGGADGGSFCAAVAGTPS